MLNSSTFPNHPRYQLRYTRMCGECGRRRSARRFGSAILQFIFPIVKRMLRRGRKTSEFAPFPRRTGKGTAARSGSERAAATVSVRPAARSGPAGGGRALPGAETRGPHRRRRQAATNRETGIVLRMGLVLDGVGEDNAVRHSSNRTRRVERK